MDTIRYDGLMQSVANLTKCVLKYSDEVQQLKKVVGASLPNSQRFAFQI